MKRFSILIAALCLCLTGCGKQTTEATAQIFAMDTVMEVAAYGEYAEQAVKYTEKRIEELENRLSRTKADSLVSGLNRDGSIRHLTYDYWNLIARAKEYRDATNGAFDITIAPVMDAWGFTFKTVAFVWLKLNRKSPTWFYGLGYWTRGNAEICLLAKRGHPKRYSKSVHQFIISPVEEHSKKPDITREKIIELAGDLPRAELFARQKTPGWDAWGNELDSDFSLSVPETR